MLYFKKNPSPYVGNFTKRGVLLEVETSPLYIDKETLVITGCLLQ
jgi:hypothetical protein